MLMHTIPCTRERLHRVSASSCDNLCIAMRGHHSGPECPLVSIINVQKCKTAYSLNLNPKRPSPNQQEQMYIRVSQDVIVLLQFWTYLLYCSQFIYFHGGEQWLEELQKAVDMRVFIQAALELSGFYLNEPKCRRAVAYSCGSGFISSSLNIVKTDLKSSNDLLITCNS